VTELTSPGHRALADLTDPQHGPVQDSASASCVLSDSVRCLGAV